MKQVYVIRHANWNRVSDELTKEGKQMAKKKSMPNFFDLAISSETTRTKQTAGLISGKTAVQDKRANLPFISKDTMVEVSERAIGKKFKTISAVYEMPKLLADVKSKGVELAELVRDTLTKIPENGKGLIVSHDGPIFFAEKELLGQEANGPDKTFGELQGFIFDEEGNIKEFKS